MKSERRHELQQNALAKFLNDTVQQLKPYTDAVLWGICGLLVVVGLFMWWHRSSASTLETANTQFSEALGARNVPALIKIADEYSKTQIGPLAVLAAAQIQLAQGIDLRFTNKANGIQQLNSAKETFLTLVRRAPTKDVEVQAVYGIGQSDESLGDLDSAMKRYEEVKTKYPKSYIAQLASNRLEDLKRPSTKVFYDDFNKFDPKPAFSAPQNPLDLPKFDSANVPKETEPAGDTPSPTDTKPTDQKPVESTPAAETK